MAAMSPLRMYTGIAVIAALTAFSSWSLFRKFQRPDPYQPGNQPLPVTATITGELTGTGLDGKPVQFSQTRGKVSVCSYLFTKCPHGCSMVFTVMRELRDLYGTRDDFQLASVAVLPDQDPPEFLKAFAESQGVKSTDPWIFMSGYARETAWDFMHEQLKLEPTRETPPDQRLSSCDFCEHDLRIGLIDRQSRVRGLYPVMSPDAKTRDFYREKLIRDTGRLLDGAD